MWKGIGAVSLCALVAFGCNGGNEKKPFPTSSQSPSIPMPPSIKSTDPAGQPAAADQKKKENS